MAKNGSSLLHYLNKSTSTSILFTKDTVEDSSIVSNDATTAIGALILGLVFLLGVPGNLFIIWSILARARRRSVTTLLILNLACADGFLMCLTIFFIIYLARQNWDFGDLMCKGLFYLCNTNMYASIFLITLMSLHRLVAVVWPHRVAALASKKMVVRAIAVLWALVFSISIPALVFRQVRYDHDEQNNTRQVCASNHSRSRYVVYQYTFETVVGFLVPYGVIVSSYVCILRRLRQTKFRRKVRSEKLILAIVVMFGIFWLPYHLINIIQVVAEQFEDSSPTKKRLDMVWQHSRAVTSALAFISSCANPILYTFAGKSYIRKDGIAFMARLFEGTSLDTGIKKGIGLKDALSFSSTGGNAVKNEKQILV
ncbi:leukotriene B4 receptor 2b isoform X1 [Salvelinus fontinalis]|uniref:leukotriene B4 receptor 2b isoform X1 n=1 Tax=Salvelinus fontinalis TaxID=8038 RepID=UPI00248670A8|nr:leukotriene B4 receptor 2b isoform X1 [Salvelinus fontinalis]